MRKFVLGVVSLASIMGFLVGASSSPVAGVAVTAGFGVIASALAYLRAGSQTDASSTPGSGHDHSARARLLLLASLNSMGLALTAFAVAFATGTAAGIWARKAHDAYQDPIEFPWTGQAAPTDTQDAIDWILVQQHLRRMGYKDRQIADLYKAWLARKKDDGNPFGSKLLSPLFGQREESRTDRLIANQPPPTGREMLGS